MARKRMVTRTIKGEKLAVLCVRTGTRETFESSVILTEKFANDAKKMRYLESLFGENGIGEDVKPVAILNTEQVLTRYGMTEETFIKYATEISTTDSEDE